jgi:hypothetical protein
MHKKNSKSIPTSSMIVDGGTGSNGMEAYATQPRQALNNDNSISLYLEQLQNLRQKSGSQAMSPLVNKTANQFFN